MTAVGDARKRLGDALNEETWIFGAETAARLIAATSWPFERKEDRESWAPKMLADVDLLNIEYARAKRRLDAAYDAAHDACTSGGES